MAPGNIQSMLSSAQQPPGAQGGQPGQPGQPPSQPPGTALPPWGEDQFGSGHQMPPDTMGPGTDPGAGGGTNAGGLEKGDSQIPMVMLKLLSHLKMI